MAKISRLKHQIMGVGRKLYALRLVTGRAGNLSARLDKNTFLITTTGACLGKLKPKNIVKVHLSEKIKFRASSELPLHRLIYKNFPTQVVIHCHPPLTNVYFVLYDDLMALTYETKFYLKTLPVVEQGTLTITQPELVIKALKESSLVVVKNHGVVSVGKDFKEALYPIEILEEAVRMFALAKLFKRKNLAKLNKALKKSLIYSIK